MSSSTEFTGCAGLPRETPASADEQALAAESRELLSQKSLTFDPVDAAAWERLSADAHALLDDTLARMKNLRASPAWRPMPQTVRDTLRHAVRPEAGRPLRAVYEELASLVLPYTSGNRHPRAWGWVRGQGTVESMLADMIASAENTHLGGGANAPVQVELTVIRWLAEALDMAAEGKTPSGLLTSGATMANLLGLAVARAAKAPFDVRLEGLSAQPRMLVYCSSETHGWARKAVEVLGLGRRSLRVIEADAEGRIPVTRLLQLVERDRAAGEFPFAVIANAGTVNFAALDDLKALRSFCNSSGLWLHVDAAFGAVLKLSPEHRELVAGLESADSVAFDLHKWGSMPFGTGCLLVADGDAHRRAFETAEAYMERGGKRGMLAGDIAFSDLGVESTRDFKALRVWMQLSVHGMAKHGAMVTQNMRQAAYLESLIAAEPTLEMRAPRPANIVCFRFRPEHGLRTQAALNTLNRELLHVLQERGEFVLSGTTLAGGDYVLRVAVVNHRSRPEDFDALLRAVIAAGRSLAL